MKGMQEKSAQKFENAIVCYKYMLGMAWASKSMQAEMSAYEGLARMHLYLGNIEKVKFYDAKVFHGQYENEAGKRVHVTNVLNTHPWLRDKTTLGKEKITGLSLLQRQAEDVADAILFCATMPGRTQVEQIHMRSTHLRDVSEDLAQAAAKTSPD